MRKHEKLEGLEYLLKGIESTHKEITTDEG